MSLVVRLDRAARLDALPPLSVYVHLPWCVRKCPYCDFNSHESPAGGVDEAGYLAALEADLEASLPLVWGRTVQTIFIGGGTPSLFSPEGIDRLLASLRARLPVAAGAEVTMEANPGTFERERFGGYRDAGINRLSLGIQSFDDARLAALGRIHDGDQARAAAQAAAELFPTFNLDLMYALPGQDLAGVRADLDAALAYSPPHLSCYHLTLEPNTLFARFPPALPDDDAAAAMQDEVEERLGAAGYEHYEVSAFARPGHRARHNLNYWTFGDYLGIGAGAHGKLSFHDRIVRYARFRHPRRYVQAAMAGNAVEVERRLTPRELPFEFMLNALRLTEGVPSDLLARHAGISLAAVAGRGGPLERAVARGLLSDDPTRLVATPLGQRFLNDLQAMFLPDGSPEERDSRSGAPA
ncbi:MAG: oxygen-independent coproporphyrinogen III oxidase-like protein [Burkholderiaceae bacterium]|nr:oxygen-independent coproporphyrinogen III oxidase-like protein [Burkholderiaceae bacterium]